MALGAGLPKDSDRVHWSNQRLCVAISDQVGIKIERNLVTKWRGGACVPEDHNLNAVVTVLTRDEPEHFREIIATRLTKAANHDKDNRSKKEIKSSIVSCIEYADIRGTDFDRVMRLRDLNAVYSEIETSTHGGLTPPDSTHRSTADPLRFPRIYFEPGDFGDRYSISNDLAEAFALSRLPNRLVKNVEHNIEKYLNWAIRDLPDPDIECVGEDTRRLKQGQPFTEKKVEENGRFTRILAHFYLEQYSEAIRRINHLNSATHRDLLWLRGLCHLHEEIPHEVQDVIDSLSLEGFNTKSEMALGFMLAAAIGAKEGARVDVEYNIPCAVRYGYPLGRHLHYYKRVFEPYYENPVFRRAIYDSMERSESRP